jgi:hypothetical protein
MMFLSGKRVAMAVLAACALALAACGPAGEAPLDPKSPVSVAETYVRAFNAKDLKAMVPLVDGENRGTIEAALKDGPESEAYKGVFHPDAVAAIAAARGKVEGPRYDGGGPVFKIAELPNDGAFMIELAEAADRSWTINQYRVATKESFGAMSREPVAPLAEEPPPPPREPVRPLLSITAEAIGALAPPYPVAAAMGAGNGDPEAAIPANVAEQAAAIDPGMLRRAMVYPSYIIQLEFCGEDGAWLLADFANRLTERKIAGDNRTLFLKILSTSRDWYEASFRARDASPSSDMATAICPRATKEEFMRFVDTDWEGKAD